MRDSLARSFFLLGYEHLGAVAALSALRAGPWLLLGLLLTFLPAGRLPAATLLGLAGAIAVLGLAAAPWSGALALRYGAALARGEAPRLRGLLGPGRLYRPLLTWTLAQCLLAGLLLPALLALLGERPAAPRLVDGLGLAAGLWLWALMRLWGFVFLPLLVARERGAGATARLTLLLLLANPRALLPHFLARQALGLALTLSGLGLLLGLGALLPLQAALTTRAALRPLGLELAPPGAAEDNRPLDLDPSLRRLWRPWE